MQYGTYGDAALFAVPGCRGDGGSSGNLPQHPLPPTLRQNITPINWGKAGPCPRDDRGTVWLPHKVAFPMNANAN